MIRDDGRLLAVQRNDTGAWVTPGGILEPHESLVDGATREVFEETGTAIDVGGLVGVYQNVSTDVVSFVFRGRPRGDTSAPVSPETRQVRWITPDEADDLMTTAFACRIHDALRGGPPVVRTLAEPHVTAAKTTAG